MSEMLREMCKALRLAYVADVYESVEYETPSQFLEAVFAEEFRKRETAKVQRLIKKARFLNSKSLESYKWHEQIRFPAHIDQAGLSSLSFDYYAPSGPPIRPIESFNIQLESTSMQIESSKIVMPISA